MHKFNHVTEYTRDVEVTDAAGVKSKARQTYQVTEELTVPTTLKELAEVAKAEAAVMVEITCGAKPHATTLTVPQAVADYIRGRKLRSNQEMQADNRPTNPDTERRSKTQAWYGSQGPDKLADIFGRLSKANSPMAKKAYNQWLDEQYTANQTAIDSYKP